MSAIDWKEIVLAIREGRFEDVGRDEWNQVADELDHLRGKGNKVGKGRPSRPGGARFISSEEDLEREVSISRVMQEIKYQYDELIIQGVKPGEARKILTKREFPAWPLDGHVTYGEKKIEAILTFFNKCDKTS